MLAFKAADGCLSKNVCLLGSAKDSHDHFPTCSGSSPTEDTRKKGEIALHEPDRKSRCRPPPTAGPLRLTPTHTSTKHLWPQELLVWEAGLASPAVLVTKIPFRGGPAAVGHDHGSQAHSLEQDPIILVSPACDSLGTHHKLLLSLLQINSPRSQDAIQAAPNSDSCWGPAHGCL